MRTLLVNIYNGRYILRSMVVKDIKAKYAGSVLGPVWIIATPLYQIFLYTFLFSLILKVRFDEGAGTSSFVVYLLAGLIPWIFFSESTLRGISAFIDNAHIIKKVKFPIEVCVASVVVSSLFTFFIYMVFYSIMLIVMGLFSGSTFLLLIVPLGIQLLLIFGLSLGLGSIAVFFRDITQIVGMMLNLIFFLIPIVYPSTIIPENLRWVFNINPFYFIVEMYRNVMLRGKVPDVSSFLFPFIFSLVIFIIGCHVFRKTKDAFKDVL